MPQSLRFLSVLLVWFFCPAGVLLGGNLEGVLLDPQEARIAGAQVSLKILSNSEIRRTMSDAQGNFQFPGLPAGEVELTLSKPGFQNLSVRLSIPESGSVPFTGRMQLQPVNTQLTVSGSGKATPDPHYTALRQMRLGETGIATANNFEWKKDVGTFTFKSGTFTLFPKVLDRVSGAVFLGEGVFRLEPPFDGERNYLQLAYGKSSVQENFSSAVFRFTDDTLREWEKTLRFAPGTATAAAEEALGKHRKWMRLKNRAPLGSWNVEASILRDILDGSSPGSMMAFIHSSRFERLLFAVDPRGIDSDLGPEEVALIHYDSNRPGLWYLFHTQKECNEGTASSSENKALIDLEHVQLETQISGREKLSATATLSLMPLIDGPRVVPFGLSPLLRVTAVRDENNRSIDFIQEDKEEDGALSVIFPSPLQKGKARRLTFEYSGMDVVQDAGNGNYFVGERAGWYPSLNSFKDYATYDMTFRVPKDHVLVGTGQPVRSAAEGDWAVTQWKTAVPVAVAGFNFARYKTKSLEDTETGYRVESYSTTDVPDWMRGGQIASPGTVETSAANVTPARLAEGALVEAQNSVRLFSRYFGKLPFGRIAVSQQPNPNFGQSWPMLVYLPLTAFMDKTQLHFLLGASRGLQNFVDEVGSHEVSHQWWGHLVGWCSYRDQWLSEGLASLSAGLYLEAAKDQKRAAEYWLDQRRGLQTKNSFGVAPYQAGPVWLGLRLGLPEKSAGSTRLIYSKGAFIFHMLRLLMWDAKKGDAAFLEMLQDYGRTYTLKTASTEDFKAIAEKHMPPALDLQKNGRLDWFFNQWVYGTELPTYKFVSKIEAGSRGQYTIGGELTQSQVSANFAMPVPIYLELDKDDFRLVGHMVVVGNKTVPFKDTLSLERKPRRVLINAREDILCSLDSKF